MHTVRKLSTNAWISLPGINLLIGVLGILTSSLVARSLGPADRGVLSASTIWVGWLLNIGGLVNVQSITYSWAKSKNQDQTFSAGIALAAFLSGVLVPAAFVLNAILAAQSDMSLAAANIYALIIPTSLFLASLASIFLAEGAFGRFGMTRLLTSVIYTACVVLLSLLGVTSVVNLAWLNVAAPLASIALSVSWLTQGRRLRWDWAWDQVRVIGRYGFAVNLASLPSQVNLRLDQAAMALWLPPEILGYYTVAVAWASTQSFVGIGLSAVLLSKASNVQNTDAPSRQRVVMQFRVTTIMLILLGAVVTLFTPLGVYILFGSEFAPAIAPAVILGAAGAVANIKLVLHEVARGLGQPSVGIWAEGLGLVVTAVMLVALLPTWGMVGAACTSFASYLVATILLVLMTSHRTGVPVRDFVVINRMDIQQIQQVLEQARNRVLQVVQSKLSSMVSKG